MLHNNKDMRPPQTMASKAYSQGKTTNQAGNERKSSVRKEKVPTQPQTAARSVSPLGAGEVAAKKKGSKTVNALIIGLVIITIAFAVSLAFFFDVGGVKSYTAEVFLKQDNYYKKKLAELSIAQKDYESKKQEFDSKQGEIDAKNKELMQIQVDIDNQKTQLTQKENSLKTREQELAQKTAELSQYQLQIDQLVETIAKVDPAAAAIMLEGMVDKAQVARVLSKMEVKKAAAILEKMKPELASEITEMLLKSAQ